MVKLSNQLVDQIVEHLTHPSIPVGQSTVWMHPYCAVDIMGLRFRSNSLTSPLPPPHNKQEVILSAPFSFLFLPVPKLPWTRLEWLLKYAKYVPFTPPLSVSHLPNPQHSSSWRSERLHSRTPKHKTVKGRSVSRLSAQLTQTCLLRARGFGLRFSLSSRNILWERAERGWRYKITIGTQAGSFGPSARTGTPKKIKPRRRNLQEEVADSSGRLKCLFPCCPFPYAEWCRHFSIG